jgi:hypothetical protein
MAGERASREFGTSSGLAAVPAAAAVAEGLPTKFVRRQGCYRASSPWPRECPTCRLSDKWKSALRPSRPVSRCEGSPAKCHERMQETGTSWQCAGGSGMGNDRRGPAAHEYLSFFGIVEPKSETKEACLALTHFRDQRCPLPRRKPKGQVVENRRNSGTVGEVHSAGFQCRLCNSLLLVRASGW